MKRNILVLLLTLGLLLLTFPGFYSIAGTEIDSQDNQNDSHQVKEERKPVFDINGKRLRSDERYVAERSLQNGRIIAYRRNNREIAALVKALRTDGVTDEKLLNPKTWMKIICDKSISSGCQGGCTVLESCENGIYHTQRKPHRKLPQASWFGYCSCKG